MNSYVVDRSKWATMNIFDQMGNIYAEVGRTIQARKTGDQKRFEAALSRTLDLFDATTEVQLQKKSPKVREVLLAKYQFLSLFFAKTWQENEQALDKYFMQFAVAARLKR